MLTRPLLTVVSETWHPEVNGVARTLTQLVRLLIETHDVQVVRPRREDRSTEVIDAVEYQDVMSFPIPAYGSLRFGRFCKGRLLRLWRQRRPERIYVATPGPLGWSAVLAAQSLGIAVSSGYHTHFPLYVGHYGWRGLQRVIEYLLRSFHQRTQVTLVPTRQMAEDLGKAGFARLAVWSRGVDSNHFTPAKRSTGMRTRLGISENDLVMLYVGRLAAEKNIDLVLHCYSRARQRLPSIRLVMAGDGPSRRGLEDRSDIILAGTLEGEALASCYASADIFLFPSETDTFGNVVLEAMASGLAIVSYDSAAAHALLSHGQSAMLAPPGDAETFCNMALSLSLQATLRQQLGQQARQIAEQQSWTKLCADFLQLTQEPETHEEVKSNDPTRRSTSLSAS